ncbi:MAG: glycosyltransferase [Nitrospira sp.]|nr:glycosyltransferase [Nitrospira sp.]
MSHLKPIAIIQRHIPHYRIELFSALEAEARRQGYQLTVFSGEDDSQETMPFSHRALPMRHLSYNKNGPGWMVGLEEAVAGSDVIVAPHELHCPTIPYLWMRRRRLCTSWIWWGHGYNFQVDKQHSLYHWITSTLKNFLIRRGDGLITYTQGGAQHWCDRGVPADRVMPFLNTIDVEGLWQASRLITDAHLAQARKRLRLEDKQVLLFSGRLYAEKQVDFLLQALSHIQLACPNTALLILGDGQERRHLEDLCQTMHLRDVHFLGEITNTIESSLYFRLANLLVIPGLVGLAIVHGFAFTLPLITTQRDFHSPEIEYLSKQKCKYLTDPRKPAYYSHLSFGI